MSQQQLLIGTAAAGGLGQGWNPIDVGPPSLAAVFSNVNQTVAKGSGTNCSVRGVVFATGKQYLEIVVDSFTVASSAEFGIASSGFILDGNPTATTPGGGLAILVRPNGQILTVSTSVGVITSVSSFLAGTVLGFAVDIPNGDGWIAINNAWVTGDPSTGASPLFTFSVTDFAADIVLRDANVQGTLHDTAGALVYTLPTGFTAFT